MTLEQRIKLDALLAELNMLPTPELIREAGQIRIPAPLDDAGRKRIYLTLGGAIAAQKLLAYITALRSVDEQRDKIGREVHRLRRKSDHLRSEQSLDAAEPMVLAAQLSGEQEVMFHLFAVCVGRIERLLPIAARAAGYKMPKVDRDLLASFRPLRDYYEHFEERLPGGKNQAEVVREVEENGKWHIRMGLHVDGQSRIVIEGRAIDVTPRGLRAVEDVLHRTWQQLRVSAIAEVREYFEANPSEIPGPEAVDETLLVASSGPKRTDSF